MPTDILPGRVLAATYSFANDSLYVLDEPGDGSARLWVQDLEHYESRTLGSFERHPAWDEHALLVDAEGHALLASSSSSLDRHAIARLDARTDELTGLRHGSRPFALPPHADTGGFTLVLPSRPGWPDEAVVGLASVALGQDSRVAGDVAVVNGSSGRALVDGVEAFLGQGAVIEGSLRADDVRIGEGAAVRSFVGYNSLVNHGSIGTDVATPLALPLPLALPVEPSYAPGGGAVTVPGRGTRELSPGAYGHVSLRAGRRDAPTRLRLAAGSYDFARLDLDAHSRLECLGRCEVRVAGRLGAGAESYLGPAAVTDLAASDVVIIVAGQDHAGANTVAIGARTVVRARLFAPRGTLSLGAGAEVAGTLVARDVRLGEGARVSKDEGPAVYRRLADLGLEPATLADLGAQL